MLSIFPSLLDFSSLAPVILRLALGGFFLNYGLRELIKPSLIALTDLPNGWVRVIGAWEILIGLLIIVGLFLQIASLLAGLELLGYLFLSLKNKLSVKITETKISIPTDYLLILLAITLALMFLGPGLLAFDLPL